jgi:hypothetical protein
MMGPTRRGLRNESSIGRTTLYWCEKEKKGKGEKGVGSLFTFASADRGNSLLLQAQVASRC